MRVLSFFDFQVNYMLYWWFHFEKEILVNCLFTQWKWTYILDLEPWKRSALNMGYMNKQASRMQGLGQGWGRSRSGMLGLGSARIGGPRLWLFRCCPYVPLWHVQRWLGVFKEPWATPKEILPTIFLVTRSMSWFIVLLLLLLNYKLYFSPKNCWITIQMDRSYHCFTL